jgi:hypothetical protein
MNLPPKPVATSAWWLGIRPEHILTGEAAKARLHCIRVDITLNRWGLTLLVWVRFGQSIVRVRTEGQSPKEIRRNTDTRI